MTNRPFIIFTAMSITAHAALFGLWPSTDHKPEASQKSDIEIGLVMLPKIEKIHTSSHQQMPQQPLSKTVSMQSKPVEAPPAPPVQMPEPATEKHDDNTSTKPENSESVESASPSDAKGPIVSIAAAPLYSRNRAPVYPADALRHGWEGEVWLVVSVSRSGTVSGVEIDKSSGYPVLDETAIETVQDWHFTPARFGSEPVVCTVRIPIRFRIKRT